VGDVAIELAGGGEPEMGFADDGLVPLAKLSCDRLGRPFRTFGETDCGRDETWWYTRGSGVTGET